MNHWKKNAGDPNRQVDYNQMIVWKLNDITQNLNYPITIQSSDTHKDIFETLELYDEKTNLLADKYLLKFNEMTDEYIIIGDQKLYILV